MAELPIILVLNNVRSLHNVGSLFRTAAAANIKKIVLGGLTPTPPRAEISKTALGGVDSIPWIHVLNLNDYLTDLKQDGYQIIALEQTSSSKPLFLTRPKFPLALIVGHEREGVEQNILKLCDYHIELPMSENGIHSLNVSNAGSIALYELWRQFCYDKENHL